MTQVQFKYVPSETIVTKRFTVVKYPSVWIGSLSHILLPNSMISLENIILKTGSFQNDASFHSGKLNLYLGEMNKPIPCRETTTAREMMKLKDKIKQVIAMFARQHLTIAEPCVDLLTGAIKRDSQPEILYRFSDAVFNEEDVSEQGPAWVYFICPVASPQVSVLAKHGLAALCFNKSAEAASVTLGWNRIPNTWPEEDVRKAFQQLACQLVQGSEPEVETWTAKIKTATVLE